MSVYKLKKIKEYLEENLAKGFFSPISSLFLSTILFIYKIDENFYSFVDCYILNVMTVCN